MKSDREFLDEMWEKVSQTEYNGYKEYEETQKKAAEIRHKKIVITNIIIALSVIIAFAFFIIVQPLKVLDWVYIISVAFLTAAYWLDKFISGVKKTKNNRQREE